jgi:hypothetical protein
MLVTTTVSPSRANEKKGLKLRSLYALARCLLEKYAIHAHLL